jgi:hypothetical protein
LYRMAAEVCNLSGEIDGKTNFHHPMAYGEAGGIRMKRFSKIKETDNCYSKLRFCFEYEASTDPVADLHTVGLLVSHGIRDVRSRHPRHVGRAYILSDSRLEEAQTRLCKMGWEEMPEI